MPFDIISLVETHAYEQDLSIPGFKSPFKQERKPTHNSRKSFGGIAVFVKSYLIDNKVIQQEKSDNPDVIWLRFDKTFLNSNCHLYIACTYLSPLNKYNSEHDKQSFDKLRRDVEKFSSKGFVLLLGDFNARTGLLNDFTNITNDILNDTSLQSDDGINGLRNSEDKAKPSKRGKDLIAMCNELDMSILNGRTPGDVFGRITCFRPNGCSVVDYGICSNDFIKSVLFFKVDTPLPWLSDHSAIQVAISVDINGSFKSMPEENLSDLPVLYSWNQKAKVKFTETVQSFSFKKKLSGLADTNDPDTMVFEFNKLLHSSLDIIKPTKPKDNHKNRNSWYNDECKSAKLEIRKLGKTLKLDPFNSSIRIELANKRKLYKSLLRKSKRNFQLNKLQKMSSKSTGTKNFWRQFKTLRGDKGPDISRLNPAEVRRYFSELLNSGSNFVATKKFDKGPLDYQLTLEELTCASKKLLSGKSCGIDGINNEILALLFQLYPSFFQSLFNVILSTGKFPSDWSVSLISPVHKKGSWYDILNFRGISLTPCISKFFETVLNNRLLNWCGEKNILSKAQLGFVKGNRTSDAHIILNNLINKYCHKNNKYLYSSFVDFEKAFDNIPRSILFDKLSKCGITGNFFNVILSMYTNNTAMVKLGQKITLPFSVDIGVRQGCVLSPTLFNIFLTDFCKSLDQKNMDLVNIDAVTSVPGLIWADDILLISTTKHGLQNQINALLKYSKDNGLKVNTKKTKCLCFNRRGILVRNCFYFNDVFVEDVNYFKYLGFIVSSNGNIRRGIEDLHMRAKKAYYFLRYTLGYMFRHKVDVTLSLFDALIKPILLYNSDFWGFSKTCRQGGSTIEELCNIFYKKLLGVSNLTSNKAVLLELNRYPLNIDAQKNCMNNWIRINCERKCNDLLYCSYKNSITENLKWPSDIQDGLREANLGFLWNSHITLTPKSKSVKNFVENLRNTFFNEVKDLFSKTTSKLNILWNLRSKENFRFPPYLENENRVQHRIFISKLRLSDHDLEIEKGRYKSIPRNERYCPFCIVSVEDELHFLFKCLFYVHLQSDRDELLQPHFDSYSALTSFDKFFAVLQKAEPTRIFSSYLKSAFDKRSAALVLQNKS